MKKTIFLTLVVATLCSCEMDFYRSDTMTSSQLKDDPGAAVYTTDGNYSMFKDVLTYDGSSYSGNTYIRHYFQMSEFRGDNVCLSGRTSDPLYQEMCYNDDATLRNNNYMWYIAYKIIYGANSNIEGITDGYSAASDQLKGENYFMRAICHLHLVTLYAKPYSCGRDNPGVVLRTSTDCSVTKRATVGEVYDQIVKDLQKAISLMSSTETRGNAGYISKEAAQGLLTRVYLYMENNDACIALADEILGSNPASKLDPDVANYFINAKTSVETLWCVAHVSTETQERSSIGSMYFSPDGTGGTGWAEMYYSDPLLELYQRYPQDLRYKSFCSLYGKIDGSKMIHWPINDGVNNFRSNLIRKLTYDTVAGKYYFTESGTKYYVQTEIVNTYPQYYIENYGGAAKTKVYFGDDTDLITGVRQTFPMYMMSKFSWQDGDPMLSSPVMIRWAEVILNRAEANAKKGNAQKALDDVNIIRTRAGLTGDAQMTLANYQARGYSDVLGVVLDERRMELCFEGHRAFDVYRNKLKMDRRFAGVQPWEVVDYTDNRIPYRIPYDEISVSGIAQNN